MKNKLILFLALFALVHCTVAAFYFGGEHHPLIFMAIVIAIALIGFGSYLALLKPKSDSHATTQQYIVATTVQILSALAFLIFAKFAAASDFKPVAFHFLAAFFGGLIIQSFLLIRFLNGSSNE